MTIGGIQTYIRALSELLSELGFNVKIYQYAETYFERHLEEAIVIGVNTLDIKKEKRKKVLLFDFCMKTFNDNEDLLIFACESMIVDNKLKRSIAIQHGVSWDVKGHENLKETLNRLYLFKKAIKANRIIKRIHKVKKLVCVDYNFVNWYRSQVAYEGIKLHVIPNFTDIPLIQERGNESVKIIFARRLVERRGTKLFTEAIVPLLKKYPQVSVTIAGEGPDLEYMKNQFKDDLRISFLKYEPRDSIRIHSMHDIAVVPTIGSEGTSLSLLEAMASQCAVVATNVGGMTNIIIDNYNGLLISPDAKQLYEAIEKLVIDKKLRGKLSEIAYETVKHAFNSDIWKERWKKLLNEI